MLQPNLTNRELAPSLWSRVNLAKYLSSLKTCRNFIVQIFSKTKNHPNFEMISTTKYSNKKMHLIPFVFNQDQTYVLELSDYSLHAYTDLS